MTSVTDMTAAPTTVREAFFEVARRLGLTTVFGSPGSAEETLLENFPPDFRYVLALHEACAIGMADGYLFLDKRVWRHHDHRAERPT